MFKMDAWLTLAAVYKCKSHKVVELHITRQSVTPIYAPLPLNAAFAEQDVKTPNKTFLCNSVDCLAHQDLSIHCYFFHFEFAVLSHLQKELDERLGSNASLGRSNADNAML
jgi:hypothetical protein